MNRRRLTAREIYGYGLIAGIPIREARRMEPGFVMDMYWMRGQYDARMSGMKTARQYLSADGI